MASLERGSSLTVRPAGASGLVVPRDREVMPPCVYQYGVGGLRCTRCRMLGSQQGCVCELMLGVLPSVGAEEVRGFGACVPPWRRAPGAMWAHTGRGIVAVWGRCRLLAQRLRFRQVAEFGRAPAGSGRRAPWKRARTNPGPLQLLPCPSPMPPLHFTWANTGEPKSHFHNLSIAPRMGKIV